jgi:hypothetical protein
VELAVIPVIFVIQTAVSYGVSVVVAKAFRFKKRPANFVTAMGVSNLHLSVISSIDSSRSSEIRTLYRFLWSSRSRKH